MTDSPVLILSFVVGGLICALAQVLLDLTRLSPARILVFLVCFGVFLGAVGLYKPIFEAVGCGISVPLIGFGGAVARGVKEAVINGGFLGALGGAFSAMGAGCVTALAAGLISSFFVKGKSKKM